MEIKSEIEIDRAGGDGYEKKHINSSSNDKTAHCHYLNVKAQEKLTIRWSHVCVEVRTICFAHDDAIVDGQNLAATLNLKLFKINR